MASKSTKEKEGHGWRYGQRLVSQLRRMTELATYGQRLVSRVFSTAEEMYPIWFHAATSLHEHGSGDGARQIGGPPTSPHDGTRDVQSTNGRGACRHVRRFCPDCLHDARLAGPMEDLAVSGSRPGRSPAGEGTTILRESEHGFKMRSRRALWSNSG